MGNNKFVGGTNIGVSDFHSRLLADMASRRKLKAREAFTVPFHFLCDYADQSDQHISFIAMRLETLKEDIAVFHEKNHQVPEHSKGEKLSGLGSCSVPLEKSRTWARGKSHKNGCFAITIKVIYKFPSITVLKLQVPRKLSRCL
jgi:hypothetical protein